MQNLAIRVFLLTAVSAVSTAKAQAQAAAETRTKPGLTLEKLRAELAAHPEVTWVAAEGDAVSAYSGKVNPFGMPAEFRAMGTRPEAFATPAGLPTSLDWRTQFGRNWLPPVRDQGRCGSCVAFAAIGTLESNYNIAGGVADFNARFSEQDLFSRIGTCSEGSEPDLALDTMKQVGVPDAVCSPYLSGHLGTDIPTTASCSDISTRELKISEWHPVTAEQAKAALQHGPLLTVMDVYEDFMFYSGGVYRHVTGDLAGGHAIVIVGYDDAAQAWIVRNSWGPKWGENGYFRIAYDDISGLGTSNYALTVSNDSFVKVATPSDTQAVAGAVAFQAANPRAAVIDGASYTLTGLATKATKRGVFDQTALVAAVNTGDLPDDTYVLDASVHVKDHQSRDWYQFIEVVNHPQQLQVQLKPSFDASKAVAKAAFTVHIVQQNVGLTSIELQTTKDGRTVTETYPSPGTDAALRWHGSLGAGNYTFTAVGKIGDLQEFRSNSVAVQLTK